MLFSAITISLLTLYVRCHSDTDKGEICQEAGAKAKPYLNLLGQRWCKKVCLKKPVRECYSNPLAEKFCFCLKTPLEDEEYVRYISEIYNGYKLCEVTSTKAEYSSPLSDWYCKNACSHPYKPTSVSNCTKDPVARFACLCDGVALGQSVAPPEHLPNSDKICTNVAPRSEFYR